MPIRPIASAAPPVSSGRSVFAVLAVLAVFLPVAPVRAAAPQSADAPTSFTFAWVTDTHIVSLDTGTTNGDRTAALRNTIAEINAERPDFVFHGGDMTEATGDPSQVKAFSSLMKGLTMPWYPVPGNHDVDNNSDPAKVRAFIAHGFGRGPANREFYGFSHKGAAFFVINAFAGNTTAPEQARRADQQLAEMETFFSAHPSAPAKIVCGHAPPFVARADEPDEYFNMKQPYRRRLLAAMQRSGAHYYLSGHRHLDAVTSDSATGITVFTQTSLAFQIGKGGRSGHYIFTLEGPVLTRRFHPLALPAKVSWIPGAGWIAAAASLHFSHPIAI